LLLKPCNATNALLKSRVTITLGMCADGGCLSRWAVPAGLSFKDAQHCKPVRKLFFCVTYTQNSLTKVLYCRTKFELSKVHKMFRYLFHVMRPKETYKLETSKRMFVEIATVYLDLECGWKGWRE
jgi:hypothetical protein